ncbi:fibrous sheath-interacting protein 2-like [Saccopteryx leptura]|uniref:fibrous sheath-interacting protein 2-like n=1 Tax=Saccopteryx leptura TaxID=249018 RepID=UPI00339CF767
MDLYLSACSKAASVAATKTASSSVAENSQKCGYDVNKTHFPVVGAAELLDLPLGVKLPAIPGSNTLFYTTKLNQKLFQPSYGFNLSDPYCRLLENQYKSLHDPHLRAYHSRKDILRRLKKGGYITSNNKIVCNLRELNKYRQYLTSLKLDFERNYIREQKMLGRQLKKLQENSQIPRHCEVSQFKSWLLQQDTPSFKDQERLIRHRYLDMISRELEQREHTAEEQRLLQMDREERQLREQTRRKLSLRRKIEEEWKQKEMLLLTKIGEDNEREARVEEQRRRCREERDKKKQATLEKKMAYHLQRLQENDFRREEMGKNTCDYRGQDGTHFEYPATNFIDQSQSNSKNVGKKSSNPVFQSNTRYNGTEKKKDGLITKKSNTCNDKESTYISAQDTVISAQTSPTKNFFRSSQSYLDTTKPEKDINADWNERQNKKLSCSNGSGPQDPSTHQCFCPPNTLSNTQQNFIQDCFKKKVTSQELNSIIQNIMTWVVATVTSILYPAITKYEERLKYKTFPASEDSVLSSDSSSFCSTCNEEFTYGSYTSATTKTFQDDPCAFAVDISIRRPPTALKPPCANVERTVSGKTHHMKGQSITPKPNYNKNSTTYAFYELRSCKSDSYLLTPFETGTKKSKDATTETDGLKSPQFSDQKVKDEIKNLKNMFVNFKCHLKGETELILEGIFQEIMSDLTLAIPSISSVTAEVFVDESEPEKRDLLSNVDISSVASEIVESMLEKLYSTVEKKYVAMFSQEGMPVDATPSLTPSGEYLTPSSGEPLKTPLPHTMEPLCDIADDMVHAILQKLVTHASCKQDKLPHLEDTTKFSYQQHMTDPTSMFPTRTDKEKCSHKPDAANLIDKGEIKNLISNSFSQSSLVAYIEEAISAILGYVQTELKNEKLIASEETVEFLQLLNGIFTKLHQEPEIADVQKCRHSRLRNPSDPKEKYRLTGTRLSSGPRSRKPFPPINVPGMVLDSEDDNEEIDKIVENVLDSSLRDEKAKSQEQNSEHWCTKRNTCFEYERHSKPPLKPTSLRSKVTFSDEGLKTELPCFNNEGILKKKPCLNKDTLIFSQDQKHQIQKASENVVKSILTEMVKDISSVSPGHLGSQTGKEVSVLALEKSQGLSLQEWIDQMFSLSEINTVAQEITDAVLNILHNASSCIPNNTKRSISSSVHQTPLDSSDIHNMVKEAPNKKPLKIWFDSENKMKYLSSLHLDPTKPSLLKSEESELESVDDIIDNIINIVFKKLKLFIYPKLQMDFKPSLTEKSSLHSQLSIYTTKVINIVLRAIQNELELNKKNLNLQETDCNKSLRGEEFFADTDKLESLVSNLNKDIMAFPLLTCICEMLSSGHLNQSSISLPTDKPKSSTSYGSDNVEKQNTLSNKQDKKSFLDYLATPCALHSDFNGKDYKENTRLQVLDSIGETLYEMLCKLIGAHPDCQPSCSKLNREKINGNQQTKLQSNIQFISKTILEYILEKLCSVDMDTNFASSETITVSESLDIDSLSFHSIIEEMAKCIDVISSIVSQMFQESNKVMAKRKSKTTVPMSSKTESTEEGHLNKLKAMASDILNMVFAKLEGFANGNLESLDSIIDGNKESSKKDLQCERPSVSTDTHEEQFQSVLYLHAKKVSSTILKAIQTELNMNSLDLRTSIKTPPKKQILKNIVSLILNAVSSDVFNETESEERDIETYRYRPVYGNFLPGGAESDSFLEDAAPKEEEFTSEITALKEETESDSIRLWDLEKALNKIELKLKEPQKSPIIPIIRNILNEIFQDALVNQLNVLSLSHSHLSGIPHNVDKPIAQTLVPLIDKMTGPLVSEADVTIVADDVIRTVLHKLYSVALTQRNASENRYKTITFSANVSFHEHTYGEKSSVTMLGKNPCTTQSRFNADKQAKINVAEDIVQAVLTNLETFATSKVISLFYPQMSFRVPVALADQQDKSTLSRVLSAKDSNSDDQFFCSSEDHIRSPKINNSCLHSLNKLNTHATKVARKILQGIKHELDKERENPFLSHNIVVSEGIASQIVNTVLDIVSSKGRHNINISDKELNSDQQEGIIETMFNKTEYRKILQLQIQDTIEYILYDIYEKTLYQNNLSFSTPTLQHSMAGKHSGANSEMHIEGENRIIPKFSVPKSHVILISSDIVDIVLRNLSSAIMLGIEAEDPTSAGLPLTFCDMFPQTECQPPPLMRSKGKRKTQCVSSSRSLKSAYAVDSQITVVEEEDTMRSAPDPHEENAKFITKTIFNQLESFITERIDSLITFDFQPKEMSFVSPEPGNCKQDDSIFHESSEMESNVNVLKISTENALSQELIDSTFSSYKEKLRSTVHLPQASLKEYADTITSIILNLIKNDLDLEIQKAYSYPNNISFQENIFVSEMVNSILKILNDKRSEKEISFYPKDNPNLFPQLTVSSEMLLEQREQEENMKLSLFSQYPLESNHITLEEKYQGIVLKEIFMRNGQSKQKEKTALLSGVKEVLNKVYQRIMEMKGHLPSFNEIHHFVSNSKIKTSDTIQQSFFQLHINGIANDIVEIVLEEMYSVVVTSLYKSKKEASENNDTLPKKPSCARETEQARKGSNPTRYMMPQVYLYTDNQNDSLSENSFLQYSSLQVGNDLVLMVLNKITDFASFYLEEASSLEGCSDESQPLRLHSFKVSLKDSPRAGFKTSLKTKSKVTPLPKFRTKPHLGPNGVKSKSKTKLGLGERTLKDSQTKTTIGLPRIVRTGDAKSSLEMKLPTSELKVYAKHIISNILETIVKEFEKVKQTRAMVNVKALQSNKIIAANKIVYSILQGLYAANTHSLTHPIKFSHLDNLKHSQENTGPGSLAKTPACFYLENVSSQLEQIFPKDGIFRKMFDKWQIESNDMESEKCNLLMIAENALTAISIKAKEFEYSLSLLNLPYLEECESRFHNRFKGTLKDTETQINMFAREIVEMLFEKLQLCFLSQIPTPDSKDTLANRKHITTKSKYGLPTMDIFSSITTYNMDTKDQISLSSTKQIIIEIVERMLNILESFVDLQFKHISKYEFSEIVKMPIGNLFPIQQRLLSKKMLPKLQPLKNSSNESKLSTIISKENVQNTLLQVHSFHSELLSYAVNIIRDMLVVIKNKVDKEIRQVEPSSISILNENTVASEIIGTLIDQCACFNKSLIKNPAMFPEVENTYTVNQVELATNMKIPRSKLKQVNFENNPPQINVSGMVFHSEEDMKNYRASPNLSSYARASTEDTIKSSEPMERPDSEYRPTCSRNKVQDYGPREWPFNQAMKGNSSLPEGSILQKLFKKGNESTEESLKQGMSFIKMGKGINPKVFHYETLKPLAEPCQTETTVSPLKICLAAENIVNTVLTSYGFPSQSSINESMETMKPFFISKQNAGGQNNEEKSLLRMWDNRISCITKEENKNSEDSREDSSLFQKWKDQGYPKIKTLKEFEVISFADHELGPNEINLVARHVTTSVVTYFKNFNTRASSEKTSTVSMLSEKKYESKQPLRSIYDDSSLYQFCDHLTESVICHLISSISDSTKDDREREKAWENQNSGYNKIISVDSQVFRNRSISIGELAFSISETIIKILFNSNILEADIAQQMFSLKTRYIYCPGVAATDFDNLFQDLLIGVIHILSKEIGMTHHFESNGRNQSFFMIRGNSVPICNKTNVMKRQIGCRDWKLSTDQNDQLTQKDKLNYLAYQLDSLVSNLKTHESKEVVNKVFNIVLDLFLPDEHQGEAMDSDQKAINIFPSSNNQQNNSILGNNLGLTPKSFFLLNVVCEKLIRTLLEKFTNNVFLGNVHLSDETSAEECQLLRILQSIDEEFDFCKGAIDCEQVQGEYMSDLLENLAEMDQDLFSSDYMLTIISHSLVKSVMYKLCHSMQLSQTSPTVNNHLKYRTREIQSGFIKGKRPELAELGQDKSSLGFMSYNDNALIESLNNPSMVSFKIQAPFGKKFLENPSVLRLKRQGTKDMDTIALHKKLYLGDLNAGIYSATFLEEIISDLFFNLSTSLCNTNENVTETHLNKMNTLFVNNVVNEFNNAHVTVLRNAEERLCFLPVHKRTVSKIVDSVYYDVLQKYKLKVTCGGNQVHDKTPIAEQITNGILLEILDYQLPSCFRENLIPISCYPLKAEIILQKLQNNLREFTSKLKSSTGYSTKLSCSFLEDIIKRLLSQLTAQPSNVSILGKKYFMSSDFNEMSNCIINKVISAISKHNIWFTIYDNQHLCIGKNLQKMVDSVYSNIIQTSDSLVSIQRSIISQSPIMVDRIASFIIQEIIENHLQPFLCEKGLSHPHTPLDAISNMVTQVLSDVTESYRPKMPSPLGNDPDMFTGEIVARLLSKIFSPTHNTEIELRDMTQKIVKSINNHFDKAKIHFLCDDKEQSYHSVDTDIVDELVTSVYRNVLKQHGLDPEINKESEDSEIFVENITKLTVAAISDYLLHPLFSGDLLSSCSISTAENIVQNIMSNISKSTKPSQSLSPYNTLLPYTFLEDMIGVLLSRIFPSASNSAPNTETLKSRPGVNFNEIASNLISDIRKKISQHEIQFSNDEEETKFVYSEDDVQHLVDSVFKNISQNSESQESVEQNITSSNDVLIDRIAGYIIKYICQHHLQPFVDGKSLPSSSYTYPDNERKHLFYASVYSSTFLEDVVSGVLSKIFHRVLGIVQTKSIRESEDELFDKAEKLIHLIAEEFSKAQISIIENAEEQLCLPLVERDTVKNIIDMVFSKVLQEYEMKTMPNNNFLYDTKTLATRITKIILAETFDFQIHPNFIGKLPFKSHSQLNVNVLIKRVRCDITKKMFQRQASTIYTTMLSHAHLEKIITQLISQMSPLASSIECTDTSQSDLSNTVIKLMNEIMSIISKHAICIIKHGNEKQNMISEKDIQSMVDSIYADLLHSNLYQSLSKDKKDISNMPVSKIASFIIKAIFNHHIQSFLSGDKTFLSAAIDQNYEQKAADPKQRGSSFIVNSTVFLEEVISELLCKLLYAFSHNILATENPDTVKVRIAGIVTTLAKSIVQEFTTSEILVADYFDGDVCSSERYKEMIQKTVNLIYEKILNEYQSLIQVYKAIQSDTTCFGRKIYNLLLEEIYDYQVQSLVSGELVSSSYSSPQADNIIRKVLNVLMKDSHTFPSCITVLHRSLLEDIIYKLLVHIFPLTDTESELKEEDTSPDSESVDAASKLTDKIIEEISEHEIRLATAEENAGSTQLEVIENLIDSICNNILKKSEFQAEVKKDADKKGGSFLSKIAGFIMKEIMDHHLQPFLHGEESFSSDHDSVSVLPKPNKEKTQTSVYSATFLEDVIVDLVHKFYSLPSINEESKKKEMPETDIVGLAIKFANSLIGEFRKSEIKVLPSAEEMSAFPPIDKETVDKISDFVYDQFIGKYESNEIQKGGKNNLVIEMIAALAQKAISAFKIQPLFSGDWSSTFFSFLNLDNIAQRVQHLPQKASTQKNRCLKENQLNFSEQSYRHTSTSNQKNMLNILETDRGEMSRNKSVQTEESSIKKDYIRDLKATSILTTMKYNMANLLSGSAVGVAKKKKKNENGMTILIKKYSENVSKVKSLTTSVKSKDTQIPEKRVTCKNNETEKKYKSASKEKERQWNEVSTQIPATTDDTEGKEEIRGPDFETDNEKRIDKSRKNLLEEKNKSVQLSLTPKTRNTGTTTEKALTQMSNTEERKAILPLTDVNEKQCSDYEYVQNITENIYEDVFHSGYSQESANYSNLQIPTSDTSHVIEEVNNDFAQSVSIKNLFPSVDKTLPAKEQEEEKEKESKSGSKKKQEREDEKVKDTLTNEPTKSDSPQYSPKSKPGIIPAKFLEDVIIEMVNKLIFSTSPETQTNDRCQNVSDNQSQAELHDTALKLVDFLLKEFSEAQIKVFRPNKVNQCFPPVDKVSSVLNHKESTTEEASSNIKKITVDKMPHNLKVTKNTPLNKISLLDRMPAINRTLVNKVVHSSVCNILKEYRSQESICKNIKSNGEILARRLTSTVINEIFQHKLNLTFCDEVPASACLSLESKDVIKKVQKVVQTASKECQTSSPYIIMLPHKFLENVISALLSKIFSIVSKTKAEISEGSWLTELDFLQMKLLSTVITEISKDKDIIIHYVESLHPNDDEIIQLVVHSIYNNLLSHFGSKEVIQSCVASGCRILSETIVDLVLREVAGNQLQNYFSGELTPHQCVEVDSMVENILKYVIQTTDAPQPQPSHAHVLLPYNILEEAAVKFLSKLLSMFPNVDKEKNKSLETEMQNITSKILNSIQEFISKNKIKLIPSAKGLPAVSLADNETIEKVVNSVYTRVLNHSGSHTSVFKDLMGKSNVLSDIIGFLMVKEISNSVFQLQVEEELSSSELVLEAVKIMEKVVKIVDEFKSREKSSSKKVSMLDATFLEEALALFLAKIVRLPTASSKDAKNLSKPELNKIASQLTKSVTAEISTSNINLVAADPEEQILNPESVEMISQVIDSVYSNVLQQSGTHKDLYYDIKGTNKVFPKKVASLIINGISNFPLDTDGSKNSNVDLFGDLDVNRIVQKAEEHVFSMIPDKEKEESHQDPVGEETPIKIVPHIGSKPITIDPSIISEHLAVISIKTQPLEQLQMECLKNTGHSIAEVRRASIDGRSYSLSDSSGVGELKRERRTSLNRMGRLDIKPLEAVCRNSFQNIRKPDISKVELLKDVQSKNDLLIRLVAHDIEDGLEGNIEEEEELMSDKYEVVLREAVKEESLEEQLEDQVKEATKTNIGSTEAISNHITEPKEREVKRPFAELYMTTSSTTTAVTDSVGEKKPHLKKEESNITESEQFLIHRIMSSSSYNLEDLISSARLNHGFFEKA